MRVLLVCVILPMVMSAQTRSKKAHEHGHANLSIAFETTSGTPTGSIGFDSPADSIIGFEHEAKSSADKKTQAAALSKLRSKFSQMVILPSYCSMTPEKAEVKREGDEHSEVHAEFAVSCSRAISGQQIRFAFMKFFPEVEEVEVTMLAGTQQASLEVVKDKGSLKIGQ